MAAAGKAHHRSAPRSSPRQRSWTLTAPRSCWRGRRPRPSPRWCTSTLVLPPTETLHGRSAAPPRTSRRSNPSTTRRRSARRSSSTVRGSSLLGADRSEASPGSLPLAVAPPATSAAVRGIAAFTAVALAAMRHRPWRRPLGLRSWGARLTGVGTAAPSSARLLLALVVGLLAGRLDAGTRARRPSAPRPSSSSAAAVAVHLRLEPSLGLAAQHRRACSWPPPASCVCAAFPVGAVRRRSRRLVAVACAGSLGGLAIQSSELRSDRAAGRSRPIPVGMGRVTIRIDATVRLRSCASCARPPRCRVATRDAAGGHDVHPRRCLLVDAGDRATGPPARLPRLRPTPRCAGRAGAGPAVAGRVDAGRRRRWRRGRRPASPGTWGAATRRTSPGR